MALTGKKQKFADAVLAGSSNKEAAIAAGYSASTASPAGSRLVKDPDVVIYLAARRQAAEKRAASPVGTVPPPGFDLAAAMKHADPETFLMSAMNDIALPIKDRMDAAKALLPYKHHKLGEGGKKEQKQAAAGVASKGKFGASPPPLRAVK